MIKLEDAIQNYELLDYIYENEEVDTLSAWRLKQLLKTTLQAIEDNCDLESIKKIYKQIKEEF